MVIPFSFKCQVYTGYMIMKNSERKYILLIFTIITISILSSTYKCNFLGADNKQ